jgi:hypothetical protein
MTMSIETITRHARTTMGHFMNNAKLAITVFPITSVVVATCIAVSPLHAQQPAAVRVPTSVLEKYVGEWVYPDGNTVMVRLHGETLYREVPGQQVPLVPMSETLFRLGPVFTAEFIIDKAGGASQILTDGTVEFRLTRKGSPPAASSVSAEPVRVPTSVLKRYVGTYEYIPGQMKRTDLRIGIRLRGDTLIRQMGSDEDVLTPISETRFKVGNTSLVTDFVIDEAGVTMVAGSGFQQLLSRLTKR